MSGNGPGADSPGPPRPPNNDPWPPVSTRPARRRRVVLADPQHPVTVVRTIVEIQEQTSVGEVLVRNLVRAQFRLAIGLSVAVSVLLVGLPLAYFLSPEFARLTVFGVRLSWLLLGVVPFPLLFGAGYWFNRLAERNERDFVNMVES
ncbi:MAG TPA: hypothetical protein VF444_22565 [Pseudonocardiaceae bacterium]